jgi:hypothetical protein
MVNAFINHNKWYQIAGSVFISFHMYFNSS